jgi:hypothetical protein
MKKQVLKISALSLGVLLSVFSCKKISQVTPEQKPATVEVSKIDVGSIHNTAMAAMFLQVKNSNTNNNSSNAKIGYDAVVNSLSKSLNLSSNEIVTFLNSINYTENNFINFGEVNTFSSNKNKTFTQNQIEFYGSQIKLAIDSAKTPEGLFIELNSIEQSASLSMDSNFVIVQSIINIAKASTNFWVAKDMEGKKTSVYKMSPEVGDVIEADVDGAIAGAISGATGGLSFAGVGALAGGILGGCLGASYGSAYKGFKIWLRS